MLSDLIEIVALAAVVAGVALLFGAPVALIVAGVAVVAACEVRP